jgi:alpha-glucosidase (family GH31 glycosyl hydrolase)
VIDSTVYTKAGDAYKGIMGLAERTSNELFVQDGVVSLWARDAANPEETGDLPASNAYGVHPFYMSPATDSTWFGVYTNLANAQDWWVQNDNATGTVHLTTIATGGLADIVLMFGATPNDVVKRYHDLIGKPVLTPMWALGWHQCKWGYTGTAALENVVQSYEDNNLPLDAQWVDIDYMQDYRDFTYDTKDFAGLPGFVDGLHAKAMHFVPIIDAGIA